MAEAESGGMPPESQGDWSTWGGAGMFFPSKRYWERPVLTDNQRVSWQRWEGLLSPERWRIPLPGGPILADWPQPPDGCTRGYL
jgi:hypothetical protein